MRQGRSHRLGTGLPDPAQPQRRREETGRRRNEERRPLWELPPKESKKISLPQGACTNPSHLCIRGLIPISLASPVWGLRSRPGSGGAAYFIKSLPCGGLRSRPGGGGSPQARRKGCEKGQSLTRFAGAPFAQGGLKKYKPPLWGLRSRPGSGVSEIYH